MSTKTWDERITTRYTEPEKDVYEKVIELVKKNSIPKSTAQLLLVKRGLQHTQNPEPLVKTVIKEVPVEKIVEKVVYKSPPKVDESTSQKHLGTQEHVAIEEHITDGHIGGENKSEQRPSADIRTTQDKAGSPPDTALDIKKSATKENGVSGWTIAGGLGLVGLLIYILVR